LFAGVALLATGLFGDHGLTESLRAGGTYAQAQHDLGDLRQENTRLRDEIRRLRDDPVTIESVARGELGMVRPGELLVTIHTLR
jgi:cell division protein FtsB